MATFTLLKFTLNVAFKHLSVHDEETGEGHEGHGVEMYCHPWLKERGVYGLGLREGHASPVQGVKRGVAECGEAPREEVGSAVLDVGDYPPE